MKAKYERRRVREKRRKIETYERTRSSEAERAFGMNWILAIKSQRQSIATSERSVLVSACEPSWQTCETILFNRY